MKTQFKSGDRVRLRGSTMKGEVLGRDILESTLVKWDDLPDQDPLRYVFEMLIKLKPKKPKPAPIVVEECQWFRKQFSIDPAGNYYPVWKGGDRFDWKPLIGKRTRLTIEILGDA